MNARERKNITDIGTDLAEVTAAIVAGLNLLEQQQFEDAQKEFDKALLAAREIVARIHEAAHSKANNHPMAGTVITTPEE